MTRNQEKWRNTLLSGVFGTRWAEKDKKVQQKRLSEEKAVFDTYGNLKVRGNLLKGMRGQRGL